MRCASFRIDDRDTFGMVRNGQVYEAEPGFRAEFPDLRAVLERGTLETLANSVQSTASANPDFLPVIPQPSRILCVGVNYRPHVEEMGREIPEKPVVFVRFADSLVGHENAIIRPSISSHYDFEGELAVIIGKAARYIKAADALDYIAGFVPFMDGSVRDWQRHTMQFTPGKNFPASGAMGPALVTCDEVGDIGAIDLETRVNGEVMQRGQLADLIFGIPYLIEYCSSFTRLMPGDVIATGTPGGVGAARKPPRWLEAGDTVEVDLGIVGCLRNPVRDEPAQVAPGR